MVDYLYFIAKFIEVVVLVFVILGLSVLNSEVNRIVKDISDLKREVSKPRGGEQ